MNMPNGNTFFSFLSSNSSFQEKRENEELVLTVKLDRRKQNAFSSNSKRIVIYSSTKRFATIYNLDDYNMTESTI